MKIRLSGLTARKNITSESYLVSNQKQMQQRLERLCSSVSWEIDSPSGPELVNGFPDDAADGREIEIKVFRRNGLLENISKPQLNRDDWYQENQYIRPAIEVRYGGQSGPVCGYAENFSDYKNKIWVPQVLWPEFRNRTQRGAPNRSIGKFPVVDFGSLSPLGVNQAWFRNAANYRNLFRFNHNVAPKICYTDIHNKEHWFIDTDDYVEFVLNSKIRNSKIPKVSPVILG